MNTSEAGIALIRRFEGLRLQPYDDGAGYMSIGYGHRIRPGERFDSITVWQAEEILRADLVPAEQAVNRLVTVPINQSQFDALVSFVFNVGPGAFAESTMLRLLNGGDEVGACAEFARWHHAGGRRMKGLLRRRLAEAALFLSE